MRHPFQSGVIPAPAMPFDTTGAVDWSGYDRYMERIARADVTAIAVNMAAAEVTSLTVAEQVEAIRRTKAVTDAKVVAGLVATSTDFAVDLGKTLVDAGADGLVVFPPLPTFISKPLPAAIVVDHHAAVAQAAAVPIIAFNTAAATYSPGTIKALAAIDNLVAVKDAVFDIEKTADMVEEAEETKGHLALLTGNDTFVVEALLLGCPGALIGLAGTFTAKIVAMQRLAAQGDVTAAYAIWREIGPIARFIWSSPLRDYRARMKYLLMRQGVFASDMTRAPQTGITPQDRRRIDDLLDRHDLLSDAFLPEGA